MKTTGNRLPAQALEMVSILVMAGLAVGCAGEDGSTTDGGSGRRDGDGFPYADVSSPDAGTADGAATDVAEIPDVPENTDVPDSGAPADAGSPDTGIVDAAAADQGTADNGGPATDAGAQDANAPDTGGGDSFTDPDAPPSGALNDLNCNRQGIDQIPTTHAKSFRGSAVEITIGISAEYGGVGSELVLINRGNGAKLQVLESRSGAGCGWQTSYLFRDPGGNQILVYNQAAGNSTPRQWGYSNRYLGLSGEGWNPLWTDHVHPNSDFGVSTPTSPCQSSGFHFDDGQLTLTAEPAETPAGRAIKARNSYSYKSTTNQTWDWWVAEQAFYLKRAAAGQGDLRIYLAGRGGWREGPIRPTRDFNVAHGQSSCGGASRPFGGCEAQIEHDLDYAVFVWNVGGLEIGAALQTPRAFGATLNNANTIYCSNAGDLNCGSIDWHTWVERIDANASFVGGEVRTYTVDYYIGDLAQLKALGYAID
ncbi:MAG: hypothetical protein HY897_06200 [Deltaproteobacteria bacterium]|nr:hypothetical protein [Deltaproteobacteria bacterium]